MAEDIYPPGYDPVENRTVGKTVGPVKAPADWGLFIQYLIDTTNDASSLGWMDTHARDSLIRIYNRTLKNYEAKHFSALESAIKGAVRTLDRFLEQGHITQDGYTVLYWATLHLASG